jgi:hypothetical protein
MEFSRTASANASHRDWENENGSASNNCGMQGGIHPDDTGNSYLEICRAMKSEAPLTHRHRSCIS